MGKDKGWVDFYDAVRRAGTELAYPAETLVRLFRGSYIAGMPKDFTGMSVLDVGCGNGNNTLFLASLGLQVSAVEITEDICAAVRSKFSALGLASDVRVGQNRSLPFPGNSFDFVVSWNVLHYEGEEVRVEQAIAEYARVLKPGGRLILSSTGPDHKILLNCKTLGGHRYEIGRPDDFRKGTVHFLFDSENYLRFYFEKCFVDVATGRIRDEIFTETLDWFIVTGMKPVGD